jgi:urease accessory protein
MTRRHVAGALALTAIVSAAAPALAHDLSLGDQMLQPVMAAQSLLPLLAVALVCRQNTHIDIGRTLALILGLGLCLGLALRVYLAPAEAAYVPALLLAALAGALAASARRLPSGLVAVFVLGLGFAVGANVHTETTGWLDILPALAATFFATFTLLLLISETAQHIDHDWHAIGLRIAGSWIAAAAVIALALSVSRV